MSWIRRAFVALAAPLARPVTLVGWSVGAGLIAGFALVFAHMARLALPGSDFIVVLPDTGFVHRIVVDADPEGVHIVDPGSSTLVRGLIPDGTRCVIGYRTARLLGTRFDLGGFEVPREDLEDRGAVLGVDGALTPSRTWLGRIFRPEPPLRLVLLDPRLELNHVALMLTSEGRLLVTPATAGVSTRHVSGEGFDTLGGGLSLGDGAVFETAGITFRVEISADRVRLAYDGPTLGRIALRARGRTQIRSLDDAGLEASAWTGLEDFVTKVGAGKEPGSAPRVEPRRRRPEALGHVRDGRLLDCAEHDLAPLLADPRWVHLPASLNDVRRPTAAPGTLEELSARWQGGHPLHVGADVITTLDLDLMDFVSSTVTQETERLADELGRVPRAMVVVLGPENDLRVAFETWSDTPSGRALGLPGTLAWPIRCGSCLKPVLWAEAIDRGLVDAFDDDWFLVGPAGRRRILPEVLTTINGRHIRPIHDTPCTLRRSGPQPMSVHLACSTNIAPSTLAVDIGRDALVDLYRRSGLLEPEPILPTDLAPKTRFLVAAGRAPDLGREAFTMGHLARMGIGGFSVFSPVAIAAAFSALARDGQLVPPFLVRSVRRDGILGPMRMIAPQSVVSPRAARAVAEALHAVVRPGGTAFEVFQRSSVRDVALVKTGTVEADQQQDLPKVAVGILPSAEGPWTILVQVEGASRVDRFVSLRILRDIFEHLEIGPTPVASNPL